MSTPQRDTYHHGALRPALIAEARALLDAGGPSAVSLREAARRAGVSATATYRHFADKESLLAAVATEGFREFGAALTRPNPAAEPFAAMGRAYVEFALTKPGLFRLMFSSLLAERDHHPELAAAANATFEALQSAAGAHTGEGQDVQAVAVAAWGLVHGLSHLLLDGVLPREQAPEMLAAIFRMPPPGLGPAAKNR